MKKVTLFILSVLFVGCTTVDYHEGPIPIVQKVLTLDGQEASDIYARTLRWASDTFVSAKGAIELQDKDSGLVTIRTGLESQGYDLGRAIGGRYYITYKIKIEVQDGKARITCHNPVFDSIYQGSTTELPRPFASMVKEYTDAAGNVVANYEQYILSESESW